MKYASLNKRVLAGIIDYIIILVLLITVTINIIGAINNINKDIFGQGSAIIVPLILAVPLLSILVLIFNYDTIAFILILTFFIFEVLYYSLQEIIIGRTIGFKCASIGIKYQGEKNRVGRILLRNSLKTLSRYLYGLPLITMFLSKKKQTFYDILSGAVVYEVENET